MEEMRAARVEAIYHQKLRESAQNVKEHLPSAVSIGNEYIMSNIGPVENPVWIDCSYSTIRYEAKTTYTETISYQEGPMLDEYGNQVLDQSENIVVDPSAVQIIDPSGAEHIDPSGIVIEETHQKWKLQIPGLVMSSNNTGTYCFYFSNDPSGNDEIQKTISIDPSDNCLYTNERYNNVFLHSEEINDFNSLDKSQIFALHHSAIQELSRKNDNLQTENYELRSRLEALESAILALQNNN